MWKFIKYCIYCMLMAISGAFGQNPEGLTWKTGIVGVLTTIVLLCVLLGLIFFIYCIIRWLK